MKKKSKITDPIQAKNLIKAFNENGNINVNKAPRSTHTGYSDTPLFQNNNQTSLF